MAGQIKYMIDTIIARRGKSDPTLISIIKTKLILKGIHPDKYQSDSPDLQPVVQKLEQLAQELGVKL